MPYTIKKTVRFSDQLETVNYTYSDAEYDRSSPLSFFFSSCSRPASPSSSKTTTPSVASAVHPPPPRKQIRLNDSAMINSCRPTIAPLDLSGIQNGCRRTPTALEYLPIITKPNKGKTCSGSTNRRPKLTIDTAGAGTGPRFFTNLSTHYKCRSDDENGSEPTSAYFTPISPIC